MKKDYIRPCSTQIDMITESMLLTNSLKVNTGHEGGDQMLSDKKDHLWDSSSSHGSIWNEE